METPRLFPPLDSVLQPIWDALPPRDAMPTLVGRASPPAAAVRAVEQALRDPALAGRAALQAGIWLYVDDVDRSHTVSQGIDDTTGSFWHGIMHRREGDFANSHHWFRRAGEHPAMKAIAGYEPHGFINRVEAAATAKAPPADLLDLQRREWLALFAWCADEGR